MKNDGLKRKNVPKKSAKKSEGDPKNFFSFLKKIIKNCQNQNQRRNFI